VLECEEMTGHLGTRISLYYRIYNPKTKKYFRTIYFWWHLIPDKYKIGDYIIESWDGKDWFNIDD